MHDDNDETMTTMHDDSGPGLEPSPQDDSQHALEPDSEEAGQRTQTRIRPVTPPQRKFRTASLARGGVGTRRRTSRNCRTRPISRRRATRSMPRRV